MFTHRSIDSNVARESWNTVKRTVSREKVFQATEAIGELAAEDMLEFSRKSPQEIDRIYVKLRDGMPLASGMKKILPHVDVRYIVSQEKQLNKAKRVPISFYDGYDGYSSDTVWFADPINATGHTTVESIRYVRNHFEFNTALFSHVAANIAGISNVQTTIDDFAVRGFMNYAYLSKKLNAAGYLEDGLELIPDYGDKLFGTLGSDFSIYDIQKGIRKLLGTGIGNAEILKGAILHTMQIAGKEEYATDRTVAWITRNWITAALRWCCVVGEFPFEQVNEEQVDTLLDDLASRDFLEIEPRPWKNTFVDVYSLTEYGVQYASCVYIPILSELGIPHKLRRHFDFLIHLRAGEITQNIEDEIWER